MGKHSPGPWRQLDCAGAPFRIETSEGYDVASCEYPADARLIVAAPELLEALKAVLRKTEEYVEMEGSCPDIDWDVCNSLIRRIEGEG